MLLCGVWGTHGRMLRIYVTPDGQPAYLLSFEKSHVSVGAAEDNDVRLQAQGISGRHFRVRCDAAGVVLEDAGSRNGTYVNGRKVNGSQVLLASDEIRIVGFCLRATLADAAAVSTTSPGGRTGVAAVPAGVGVSEPSPRLVAEGAAEQEPPPGFDAPKVAAAIGVRARAFSERGDVAHLLDGEELRDAWTWVHCGAKVMPTAGRRERELVVHSQGVARQRSRQRFARLASFAAALVTGGWVARGVLAGGPAAYSGGIEQRLRAFTVEVERKKRDDCAERSRLLAEAARAEAKGNVEAGLRQATEALACVGNFPELRATPAEEVVRSLLATMHGQVIGRGPTVSQVATDLQGKVMAWAGDDGSVTVWDATRAAASTIEGTGAVKLLSISDDGERLIALGGGQVQLWNLLDPDKATRRVALDKRAGEHGVSAVSRDGRVLVASAGELRAFHLDVPGARLVGIPMPGLTGEAHALAVNADGTRVFAATGTGVTGWRLTARKAERSGTYGGHGGMITALGLARCGDDKAERWLLSGDAGGEVRVHDLRARGKSKPVVVKAGAAIKDLRMTADCRYVIAATVRTLQLWDLRAPEPARTPREFPVGGLIQGLGLDGDAEERVVVATGSKLSVCDLTSGKPCVEREHAKPVKAMALASLSGRAISADDEGTVRRWDIRATSGSGSLQAHSAAPVRALAVGGEDRVLGATGANATLWRSTGVGGPLRIAELTSSNGATIRAVALSPNPMWAATAADEEAVVIWRIGADGTKARPEVVATTNRVTRLTFSDDGRWLAGIGPKQMACVVAMHAVGQFVCQPLPMGADASTVDDLSASVFLPGTHKLAIGGADRSVVVVNLDNLNKAEGSVRQELGKGTGAVRVLAASPDGRWLAAGGESADGRLWNVEGQADTAHKLGGIGETIQALAFGPDGRWLAAAAGRKIYAWDLLAFGPAPVRVSEELGGTVQALAFGADGTLLSGGGDGKLLGWDLEPAEPTARTIGTTGMTRLLAVLPGGGFVVSAGSEPTLHFWPLTARPLYEMARQALGPIP